LLVTSVVLKAVSFLHGIERPTTIMVPTKYLQQHSTIVKVIFRFKVVAKSLGYSTMTMTAVDTKDLLFSWHPDKLS